MIQLRAEIYGYVRSEMAYRIEQEAWKKDNGYYIDKLYNQIGVLIHANIRIEIIVPIQQRIKRTIYDTNKRTENIK